MRVKLGMPAASVPCNGCTHCCRNTPVLLVPAAGDQVDTYDSVIWPDGD